MSHYKPYPVYKDSGIEWIGEVPEHWKLTRLKWLTELRTDRRNDSPEGYHYIGLEDIEPETGKLKPTGNNSRQSEESTVAVFFCGDVLYGKLRPYLRKAIISGQEGICSTEFLIIRPVSVSPQWLQHWLLTPDVTQQIETGCSGAKMPRTDWEHVSSIFMPNPDLTEQAIIISALDKQTARIDALITKKTRFIELLKEKRQALITHAVTKGLDPNVKMKDSGIDWIGEVPEHWEHCRVKNIVKVKVTDGPHETPELVDEGIPFISAEAVKNNKINFDFKRGYISKEDHEYFCKKCKPQLNDLFIIKSGATTGNIALVDFTDEFSIWSPLALIRCMESKYYYKFAFYVLQADNFQKQVQQRWSFGTQQNIGMGVIENLYIPLSLINEQHVIVDFLDRQTARIDLIIEKTQRSIDLLRERRSALITAAVTGKIDLRGSL